MAAVTGAHKSEHEQGRRRGELQILTGSLWRNIPLFALPVALTGILEQLSNLISVVMVGHFTGDGGALGMAAVGSNTPVSSLILNLFIGVALGSNVVIANAIGAGDEATVRRASHTSVAMAALGVVVTILGELAAAPLLHLLNVPPDAFDLALLFFRIYLLGMPSILLYNFEAAILRSIGVTKMPLQTLAFSAVLNVALDLAFIPGLGWGVAGSAIATVISYSASAAILFWRLMRIDAPVRITPSQIGIDRTVLGRIVRIGLPAGLQSAVFAVANVVIQSSINSLGTEVMAASSAALSLEYVCYNLVNSFSQACTTFVSQNFGARNIGRCLASFKVALAEDLLVCGAMIAVLVVLGRQILSLFNGDPQVVSIGYVRVCYIIPSYVFSLTYENISGYLRGFGISLTPALITTVCVCGSRFLWVLFVFPANPTFATVMMIYPISLALTCFSVFVALMVCRPARVYGLRRA